MIENKNYIAYEHLIMLACVIKAKFLNCCNVCNVL